MRVCMTKRAQASQPRLVRRALARDLEADFARLNAFPRVEASPYALEETRNNSKEDLYRSAIVEAPTHCGFTVAESLVAIELIVERIEKGRWGNTAQPDADPSASAAASMSVSTVYTYWTS